MKHVSINHTGGIPAPDLGRDLKLRGGTRLDGVRRAVASSYAGLLRRYPDIRRGSVVVDVMDMPGAASVTWVFHTGDRVTSVLAQPWTRSYHAEQFIDLTVELIK